MHPTPSNPTPGHSRPKNPHLPQDAPESRPPSQASLSRLRPHHEAAKRELIAVPCLAVLLGIAFLTHFPDTYKFTSQTISKSFNPSFHPAGVLGLCAPRLVGPLPRRLDVSNLWQPPSMGRHGLISAVAPEGCHTTRSETTQPCQIPNPQCPMKNDQCPMINDQCRKDSPWA